MSIAVTRPLPGLRAKRNLVPVGRIALGIACLVLWQFGTQRDGTRVAAGPGRYAGAHLGAAVSGELARDTLVTFGEAAAGMILGGAAGAALPFLLRLSPRLMTALDPLISARSACPSSRSRRCSSCGSASALPTKVIFVASIVFFLLFYNGLAGILSVDPRLVAMLRVAGASEWVISREIVWNTTKPFLFSGLKIALPRALSGAVVGEFIAADSGLGWYIQHARDDQRHHRRAGRSGDRDRAGDGGERGAAACSGPLAGLAPGRQGHGDLSAQRAGEMRG